MTYGQNSVTPAIIASRRVYGEYHHHSRITVFRDGSARVLSSEFDIFKEPGFEKSDLWDSTPAVRRKKETPDAADIDRAVRRARSEMRDLARNNVLPWFVTLTFDPAKIDRYDIKEITRRVGYWLDNAVRRKGLAYILVPELHQDGAVHYHGFFNDALPMVDSGHYSGSHKVFNCPAWTFGFSAVEAVDQSAAAVGYCLKYVGKSRQKIGGRWWLHGGALVEPERFYAEIPVDFLEGCGAASFHIDRLGCDVYTLDLEAGEYKQFRELLPSGC